MKFEPNQPVITAEPIITIDAGLPAGRYRFRLEVENEQGQRSKPAEIVVTIEGSNNNRKTFFGRIFKIFKDLIYYILHHRSS